MKKRLRKKRPNPAFDPLKSDPEATKRYHNLFVPAGSTIGFDWVDVAPITAAAGDILVSTALRGCTFEEKVLISALIPMLVKLLRNGQPTQEEMDKAVEKILNSGDDQTDLSEAKEDGSPK